MEGKEDTHFPKPLECAGGGTALPTHSVEAFTAHSKQRTGKRAPGLCLVSVGVMQH